MFASSGKSVWRSLEGSKVGMNKIMEQHRSKESQILAHVFNIISTHLWNVYDFFGCQFEFDSFRFGFLFIP